MKFSASFALGIALALGLCGSWSAAQAQTTDDPLHGFCSPGTTQCLDNGTNSPTTNNPPTDFGFTVSPGSTPVTGDLMLVIMTPDNEGVFTGFGITQSTPPSLGPYTASLFTGVDGDIFSGNEKLYAFLGLTLSNGAPQDPFSAFGNCGTTAKPCANTVDPGLTGFYVYTADVGTQTLLGSGTPNVTPLFNLTSGLPLGSEIVAFIQDSNGDWISTAESGAIFEDSPPGPSHGPPGPLPEPGSLALLGSGVLALGLLRRRLGRG